MALIDRLYAFNANYERTKDIQEKSAIKITEGDADQIDIKQLDVYLPNRFQADIRKGSHHKARREGSYKGQDGRRKNDSVQGFWQVLLPFGAGEVVLPKDKKVIVLPQKPYFPIARSWEAVSYPAPPDTYTREEVAQALRDVGHAPACKQVDEVAHWNLMLSGGEAAASGHSQSHAL